MTSTPTPGTFDLTRAESRAVRHGRYYELKVLIDSDGMGTPLDMAGGDITITSLTAQIRATDGASNGSGTLIATGAPVFSPDEAGDGSDGYVTLIFPETAFADGQNRDQTARWDLVGFDGSDNPVQLLEGAADIVRTATIVSS